MTSHDQFGLPVTLSGGEALSRWNAAVQGFLAHAARTPDDLAEALRLAPEFVMGQAARGLFCLMLGRREMVQTAREAERAARAGLAEGGATRRERHYLSALTAWLEDRPSGAVAAMEEVLAVHPEDALAMKISHAIRFMLGDSAGMRASVERVLPAYGEDHPARGYALGCHAFGLEETGAYARAELAGRMALALAPDDAWGLHAVAHVHEMKGDARAGLAWLDAREDAFAHCNNFRFHVWWHKALMHLSEGDVATTLSLYDRKVRAEPTDDWRDIANATSLLLRLELEGADVGGRWEELAEVSARRTDDATLVFADLHYLLALMGGRRAEAEARLLARIARDAARRPASETSARMASPGLAAAAGVSAFGRGDHARALEQLKAARPHMIRAGGSHAQRDVFERMTIDAAIRAGRLDEAAALLDDRAAFRGGALDAFARSRAELIAQAFRDQPGAGDGADGRMPAE